MPRMKLVPLDHYQHIYKTTVEVTDLNYGNHLGNDSLVGIIHRARVHFFRQLGVSEKDLGDAKTGIVLTDLVANYKAEGFLFLIALAEAGIIAFNYKKRILAKLPEQFLSALAKLMIS